MSAPQAEEEQPRKFKYYDPEGPLTDDAIRELLALPEDQIPRLSTVPNDPRFPEVNKTRACWQNYVDYLRCVRLRDPEDSVCKKLKHAYTTWCPSSWVDRWEEAREEGVSPHVAYVEMKIREQQIRERREQKQRQKQ